MTLKMTQKTNSETFFEQFCTQHGVRWEQIVTEAARGAKTPDYAAFLKGTKVITEITEIQVTSLFPITLKDGDGRGGCCVLSWRTVWPARQRTRIIRPVDD